MDSRRKERDTIISQHAKRAYDVENRILRLLDNTTSERSTDIKAGGAFSQLVDALVNIGRKRTTPMSGQEILEHEKTILDYAEKAVNNLDPGNKSKLEDIEAELAIYRQELQKLVQELTIATDEEKKKLLEDKITTIRTAA